MCFVRVNNKVQLRNIVERKLGTYDIRPGLHGTLFKSFVYSKKPLMPLFWEKHVPSSELTDNFGVLQFFSSFRYDTALQFFGLKPYFLFLNWTIYVSFQPQSMVLIHRSVWLSKYLILILSKQYLFEIFAERFKNIWSRATWFAKYVKHILFERNVLNTLNYLVKKEPVYCEVGFWLVL